jgi:hypothetical protein
MKSVASVALLAGLCAAPPAYAQTAAIGDAGLLFQSAPLTTIAAPAATAPSDPDLRPAASGATAGIAEMAGMAGMAGMIGMAGAFDARPLAARAPALVPVGDKPADLKQAEIKPVETAPAPSAAAKAPAAVVETRAGSIDRLRHLPNNAQGYRLAGEIGSSEWAIYFTESEVSGPVRFQLGYLSAVSVMPEASRLTVRLNDVEIGATAIQAPHGVKTLSFDVPAGLAKAGFNALRIAVDQRHRVDCSTAATFELWTQIDPSQTGFAFSRPSGLVGIDDVPALPPDPQGAMPIRAMLPEHTDLAAIDRVTRAVQAVAINGRFEQVLVDVEAGAAADAYGLNLAVGVWDRLRGMPGLEGLAAPSGATVSVLPAPAGGRATLVATGLTADEADQAVERLARTLAPRGSEPGLRAAGAIPGLRVGGDVRLSLRELGVASQEFSGRMFRVAFQVMLPPDFYAADYGKASLNLSGGYAPGLVHGAQLIVSVNGRNVTGVPLPKSGGEVFEGRAVPIPLSQLRPGLNRVELEAQLPTAEDASCDPLGALNPKRRFLLLDSSDLVIPAIARIARMPDLAATASGGFPYVDAERRPLLYMPKPDRETVAAAATLAARMAVSAGRVVRLRSTTRAPSLGEEATLVVGAAPTIEKEVLQATGLDPEVIAAAWPRESTQLRARAEETAAGRFNALQRYNLALQRNFPAACHAAPGAPLKSAARKAVARLEATRDTAALAADWKAAQRADSQVWAIGRHAVDALRGGARMAKSAARSFLARLAPDRPDDDLTRVVGPESALVMAQSSLDARENGVWTIVTAPTSTALNEAMACAVDPRVWAQMRGRVAALDAGEAQVASLSASELDFVTTQPLSIGNARLVAAGWFSSNRWSYTGLILLIAIGLGTATFWLVRNLGRRQA